MTNSVLKTAKQQGSAVSEAVGRAVGKAAHRALTGVVTPAQAPVSKGGGVWEEGVWGFTLGLGALGQRRYRIFVPPGVGAARPAPLLVLLHGCGQDAASFAACARVTTVARDARLGGADARAVGAGELAALLELVPAGRPGAHPRRRC